MKSTLSNGVDKPSCRLAQIMEGIQTAIHSRYVSAGDIIIRQMSETGGAAYANQTRPPIFDKEKEQQRLQHATNKCNMNIVNIVYVYLTNALLHHYIQKKSLLRHIPV